MSESKPFVTEEDSKAVMTFMTCLVMSVTLPFHMAARTRCGARLVEPWAFFCLLICLLLLMIEYQEYPLIAFAPIPALFIAGCVRNNYSRFAAARGGRVIFSYSLGQSWLFGKARNPLGPEMLCSFLLGVLMYAVGWVPSGLWFCFLTPVGMLIREGSIEYRTWKRWMDVNDSRAMAENEMAAGGRPPVPAPHPVEPPGGYMCDSWKHEDRP